MTPAPKTEPMVGEWRPQQPDPRSLWTPNLIIRVLRMHAVRWSIEAICIQVGRPEEVVRAVLARGAGELSDRKLERWVRNHKKLTQWLDYRDQRL